MQQMTCNMQHTACQMQRTARSLHRAPYGTQHNAARAGRAHHRMQRACAPASTTLLHAVVHAATKGMRGRRRAGVASRAAPAARGHGIRTVCTRYWRVQESWGKQLGRVIINNLRFSVRHVHVSIDSNVDPAHPFSLGIALEELRGFSTDENGFLPPATSSPGLGLPHLRRDWARRCHICAGTGAATSAPGLGSPLPHLRRDWARRCHICAGTGLAAATSAPGRALVATVPCAPVLPLTDRASARRAEGDHQQECWYC
jgi:hypothetical protein